MEQHQNAATPNMGIYAMPQQNMYMTGVGMQPGLMQTRPVPNMGAQMNMMNVRMSQMNLSQGMTGNKPINMGRMPPQSMTGGMGMSMSGGMMTNMGSNMGMMAGRPTASAFGQSQNFSSSSYSGFKGLS